MFYGIVGKAFAENSRSTSPHWLINPGVPVTCVLYSIVEAAGGSNGCSNNKYIYIGSNRWVVSLYTKLTMSWAIAEWIGRPPGKIWKRNFPCGTTKVIIIIITCWKVVKSNISFCFQGVSNKDMFEINRQELIKYTHHLVELLGSLSAWITGLIRRPVVTYCMLSL